jgi:hypothetical protein
MLVPAVNLSLISTITLPLARESSNNLAQMASRAQELVAESNVNFEKMGLKQVVNTISLPLADGISNNLAQILIIMRCRVARKNRR